MRAISNSVFKTIPALAMIVVFAAAAVVQDRTQPFSSFRCDSASPSDSYPARRSGC